MKILGITAEGDSGAALVEDGRVLAAINEERICRMKLVIGFPRDAIREVLRIGETSVDELDAVVVAGTRDLLADQLEPFDGWFQHAPTGWGGWLKTCGVATFSKFRNQLPLLEPAYYALLGPSFARRRRMIRHILRSEFDMRCPIQFVDHHLAHVTSAYFTSGFDDALVVSVDGGGDTKSALVHSVRGGRFRHLHEVSAFNSLGNYYAYVTHLCGFKAMKHEGKVTGLAAHGQPRYVSLLDEFITESGGTFINRGGVAGQAAIRELQQRLPRDWTREDLACSIQRHCEALTARFIRHWLRRSKQTNVALAGGVFANVRVNQEVLAIDQCQRIFIHPHMGDGGLGTGAALAASIPRVLGHVMPANRQPLEHAYLGTDLDDHDIQAAFQAHGLSPEPLEEPLEEVVAELLAQGHVVARASGSMEYGPRALGNRSILYHPTDPSVNDWLNENLQRTEFMPFAPAVLHEARELCFEHLSGGEHAAEFMTITFPCTAWMREAMPGVVHVDQTARPQLVRREVNPGFHAIIEAFHRRTGLPAVINTSFNMHEEPIVRTADDCVRAFLAGRLDYLAIGPYLVKHPVECSRRLIPVMAADATQVV